MLVSSSLDAAVVTGERVPLNAPGKQGVFRGQQERVRVWRQLSPSGSAPCQTVVTLQNSRIPWADSSRP